MSKIWRDYTSSIGNDNGGSAWQLCRSTEKPLQKKTTRFTKIITLIIRFVIIIGNGP